MNINPNVILGDELPKRWNLDARHVLGISRQKKPKSHGGSFNDEVEYCGLLIGKDFPADLENQLSKFQFEISIFQKRKCHGERPR